MFPTVDISGIKLNLYGFIFVIGFILAIVIGRKLCSSHNIAKEDVLYCVIYAAIGIIIGSKLLYLITRLPHFIETFDGFLKAYSKSKLVTLEISGSYLLGGNVFYGGLIGGGIGIVIYCRQFKADIVAMSDLFAVFIPFVHGFGRIGCFMAGCCYGREYHGIGSIKFPYNELIPELSKVPRFPTQPLEAGMNFIAFTVLLYLYEKCKRTDGHLMGIYLCYYSVFRFVMEFFRGDAVRGHIGVFSTSQIISIILLPVGISLVHRKRLKKQQ